MRRSVLIASLVASGIALSGCSSFDPTDWFNTKKPLPGDRKAVFPEGVPGVPQGVPPELVQGYQAPIEQPAPVVAEEKPKTKPKPKPRPKQAAATRSSGTVGSRPEPQQAQPQSQGSSAPWPGSQQAPAQPAPAQSSSPFPDPPRR